MNYWSNCKRNQEERFTSEHYLVWAVPMIALLLYLTSFLFVCLFFKYYLSLLRLVKQNIISPSSRGWEVQDQFSSWWRISFWLSTTFLTCSQMVCMCAHTHTHTHTHRNWQRGTLWSFLQCSLVTVMSNSLQPHGLQHARLHCPSPTPGAYSNSSPSSRWCHPTSSSSFVLLLFSIFPNIRVFSNESVLCIRWSKYWSISFSISPSKWIFRIYFL